MVVPAGRSQHVVAHEGNTETLTSGAEAGKPPPTGSRWAWASASWFIRLGYRLPQPCCGQSTGSAAWGPCHVTATGDGAQVSSSHLQNEVICLWEFHSPKVLYEKHSFTHVLLRNADGFT